MFLLIIMLLPHLFPMAWLLIKHWERGMFVFPPPSVNSSIPFRFNTKLEDLIQIHKRPHLVAFHFWGRYNLLQKKEQTSYNALKLSTTIFEASQLLAHKTCWNYSTSAIFIKLSHMNCWYLRSNYKRTSLLVKEQYSGTTLNDYDSIKSLLGTSDDLVCIHGNRNASLQASFVVVGLVGEVCRRYAVVKL